MKLLLVVLFLPVALFSKAQDQQQIDKVKTVIDYKKERYLDRLMAIVGDKRIVALGEDTHGTAEFYELRDAITRKLIKEKGFNMLILENPHEDMVALQEGLRMEKLDSLISRHLFAIYQTKQMKSFLQWFKKYSKKHPRLRLAGCDDSFRELLPQALTREIARYGNDTLNKLVHEFYLRQTLSVEEFCKQNSLPKPTSFNDEIRFGVDAYRLLERIDSICKLQAIQYPEIDELVFHAKTAYIFYEKYSKKIPVSRDEIMGDRINYHAADPNAKIIVWAHNGHISKSVWLDNELGLMGATVLKKFPNDYLAIGMGSTEGSYSYIKNRFINNDHNFRDSLFTGNLRSSKAGSWNEILAANTTADFFLDFSKLNAAERNEFGKMKPLKLMGYGKESETKKEYYDVSLTQLFDVLIYIRKTSHTDAIFNKQ